MLPLDGQETRAEKTNVTVDILTEFYARYSGLPSRFRNDTAPGQQTGRLSARPRPPSVAISVGTTPMIAIPVAAFMGSVAMIVGPAPQTWCNHFGLSRPMIAIPTADDCGALQIEVERQGRMSQRRKIGLIEWYSVLLQAVEVISRKLDGRRP